MAFPTAGASPTNGVSPAPAEGRSLRSSISTSISRKIAETRHTVIGKMRIQNSSVLEVNGFEQSAASGLYHCAFDLITQAIRVDDRAALEGFHHAHDFDVVS